VCEILFAHLKDNAQARRMLSNGSYERIRPAADERVVDSQLWMLENRGRWNSPD
jgi:polyphosphate kinase